MSVSLASLGFPLIKLRAALRLDDPIRSAPVVRTWGDTLSCSPLAPEVATRRRWTPTASRAGLDTGRYRPRGLSRCHVPHLLTALVPPWKPRVLPRPRDACYS